MSKKDKSKNKDENIKESEAAEQQDTIDKNEENEIPEIAEEEEKEVNITAELKSKVNELQDKLLRKAAEFENYKRRTENDQLNLLSFAAESFITKILPVIDDFERSLNHISDADSAEAIKEGIMLVYNKFIKILDEQGIKKIDSVGKPFNVDYHDALMQIKDDTVPPHTVVEEVEKGYLYKNKVIKHAKVIVSEDASDENNQQNEDEENISNEKDANE
ncbi:MAG: nucleotide exchange factor GrpE [Ignavibacteria bacterium]|nr:nucleotide exchange factor GrpE [Ignavibacteria bacterium]MBT8386957.1 nucleotide exchange factor GrpE [Ignavibacteria bacterium]